MKFWKPAILNIGIVCNVLLLWWALFQDSLVVPVWLQVAGRLHPLFLHFPLVLWLLFAPLVIWDKHFSKDIDLLKKGEGFLLSLITLFTSISALLGFLLANESGYDKSEIELHQWAGILVSIASFLSYVFYDRWRKNRFLSLGLVISISSLVIFTGHKGATITHGEGFITGPLKPKTVEPDIAFKDALIFQHGVRPILDKKCVGCHNENKKKGELLMVTNEQLLKGGKNGALWKPGDTALSLLLKRIHLPIDEKEHMPPKSKTQLTDEEVFLLNEWIKGGATFTQKFAGLAEGNPLKLWAESFFKPKLSSGYVYQAVSKDKIRALNNPNRLVQPIALNENALSVSFFNKGAFGELSLKELEPVSGQIAELNLSNMPVTDDQLDRVAAFEGLQILNLNYTNITALGLKKLSVLKNLKRLSLSGLSLKGSDLSTLGALKNLQTVYAWNTGLSDKDIEALQMKMPNIRWQSGANTDTMVLQLNPPSLLNESMVISKPVLLKLKHVITGVQIRYTLNGSEPDSILSPLFNEKVIIDQSVTVKARAYKKGWISSNTFEASFYKRMYQPDSVVLLSKVNENYKGDGASTLIDSIQSEKNFKSGNWLGFKEEPMKAMLFFNKPVNVTSISFGSIVEVGSYIMPPQRIEVWGSNENGELKKLGEMIPKQPVEVVPGYLTAFQVNFKPVLVNRVKLVAFPVSKLPNWHPGKGDKGWFFVDEIFVN